MAHDDQPFEARPVTVGAASQLKPPGDLSKHLRQLADAGLLSTRREGYYVLYGVEAERLRELTVTLPQLLEPRP